MSMVKHAASMIPSHPYGHTAVLSHVVKIQVIDTTYHASKSIEHFSKSHSENIRKQGCY